MQNRLKLYQETVSYFNPHEGPWIMAIDGQGIADSTLQFGGTAVNVMADPALGKGGEPALDGGGLWVP